MHMKMLAETQIQGATICIADYSEYPFHSYGNELVIYRTGMPPEFYQFETHDKAVLAFKALEEGSRQPIDFTMYRDIWLEGKHARNNQYRKDRRSEP